MFKKRKIYKMYLWSKKHWIVFSIIALVPTFITQFINVYGIHIGLIDEITNKYTVYGLSAVIISLCVAFILIFIKSLYNAKEEIDSVNGNVLLKRIIACNNSIDKSKYETLLTQIGKTIRRESKPPVIISNPTAQIKTTLAQLSECLTTFTEIKRNNLVISVAFQPYPFKTKWEWAEVCKEIGLPISELISNKRTTFHILYSANKSYVFFNDKKVAHYQNHYVMDARDESSDGIGSIICANISVGTSNQTYMNAILSIATYGQKFIEDNADYLVKNFDDNFKNTVLPEFVLKLKIELALLFTELYISL